MPGNILEAQIIALDRREKNFALLKFRFYWVPTPLARELIPIDPALSPQGVLVVTCGIRVVQHVFTRTVMKVKY